MPDPHTPESFGALTDAQKDAAIARALGWTHHCPPLHDPGGSEPWWQRPGRSSCYGAPPPYFTGGDADPFANWHLLAEVWRALRNAEPSAAWSLTDLFIEGDADEECWNLMNDWDTFHATVDVEASTPHRAACLTLVAAGLVQRGADDE